MHNRVRRVILVLVVLISGAGIAMGAEAPAGPGSERTPARLSFTDGQVSFWRPGATDWTKGQINIPLAPGDELATGSPGTLELQVGAREFIRAWADTQLGLESQEPDFLQVKVTTGNVSFDLRTLESGQTVEVDTPNAAITLEHSGYYRIAVVGERTTIITRRGGRAMVTPASGPTVSMTPSEELVIQGTTNPQLISYAAPALDDWDRWNYARTESLSESVSARYVPPGAYGVEELDRYGTWRTVPTYGEVWVPTGMPAGWVPYSTGSWILDPYYGWTWVSSLPWGWTPFHYGRWVIVDDFWAWAPGPVLARPVYAPALVAFFGTPAGGVSVSVGGPVIGWVALGWGEPCVPWWGPAGFIHRPWWGGWGGPHVVNNLEIARMTVVDVKNIRLYRNTSAQNAVVAVNREHFGHGPIAGARVARVDVKRLEPVHTGLPVRTTAASFVPTTTRGARPSEDVLRRPVVATRQPRPWGETGRERVRPAEPSGVTPPPPQVVTPTRPQEAPTVLSRPSLGRSPVERQMNHRTPPPAPPKRERAPRAEVSPGGPAQTSPPAARHPEGTRQAPHKPESPPKIAHETGSPPTASRPTPPPASRQPQAARTEPSTPRRETGRPATPQVTGSSPGAPAARSQHVEGAKPLPGEPANRLAPHRIESNSGQRGGRTKASSDQRQHGPSDEVPKQPSK
jgi:hypothetical protein